MDLVEVADRYSDLCETLLDIEFEYHIGNDCDRAEDGLNLRREFECIIGARISDVSPCSMLEMLVAVSIRTAELMYEGEEDDTPGDYFWIFLGYLGLDKMRNRSDFRRCQRQIVNICATFMDENCQNVDIVDVKHKPKNWSNLEIWKRINWFLTENYYKKG